MFVKHFFLFSEDKNMKTKNKTKKRIKTNKIRTRPKRICRNDKPDLCVLFFTTINLLCVNLFKQLGAIFDHRKDKGKLYTTQTLMVTALFMFNLNLKSRAKISQRLTKKRIIDKISYASGQKLDFLPHGDTINDFLEKAKAEELEAILYSINYDLLRSKRLDKFRFSDKYYTIAIDMTQTHYFHSKHHDNCQYCMEIKDKDDNVIGYQHAIVEAVLVTPTKLRIPIMSEFLCKQPASKKQDCEINAAIRLLKKLKKKYSKFKICILADGLYSNKNFFKLMKKFKWKFIFSFKESKIPKLHEKFEDFKKIKYSSYEETQPSYRIKRCFNFVNNLHHDDYSVNILEITEYAYKEIEYYNIFLTNIEIDKKNLDTVSQTGRLRWQIELTFRDQKYKGFYIKHAYSHNPNAMLCFHLLLLMAYWINQFMFQLHSENGVNNLKSIFGSIENIILSLYEHFFEFDLNPADALKVNQARFLEIS